MMKDSEKLLKLLAYFMISQNIKQKIDYSFRLAILHFGVVSAVPHFLTCIKGHNSVFTKEHWVVLIVSPGHACLKLNSVIVDIDL